MSLVTVPGRTKPLIVFQRLPVPCFSLNSLLILPIERLLRKERNILAVASTAGPARSESKPAPWALIRPCLVTTESLISLIRSAIVSLDFSASIDSSLTGLERESPRSFTVGSLRN